MIVILLTEKQSLLVDLFFPFFLWAVSFSLPVAVGRCCAHLLIYRASVLWVAFVLHTGFNPPQIILSRLKALYSHCCRWCAGAATHVAFHVSRGGSYMILRCKPLSVRNSRCHLTYLLLFADRRRMHRPQCLRSALCMAAMLPGTTFHTYEKYANNKSSVARELISMRSKMKIYRRETVRRMSYPPGIHNVHV